ncbi:histidine phosphatase family protein [Empedobacter falsenii]
MKNLFLMRHAKSKWNENVSDQFRSITDIGELKTKKIAHYLNENFELNFDQVFSSKAVRAKETSQLFKPILFPSQIIHIEDDLYTFSHYLLDKWIRNLDNQLQNVLIFGHNPAFTDITNQLGNEMIYNLPTSGFVWIQFDSDNWKTIAKGKTMKIITPKEIK